MSPKEQDATLIAILHKDIEIAQTSNSHTPEEIWSMGESLGIAESFNGSDDLRDRALKRILIDSVRKDIREPGRIHRIAVVEAGDAVSEHARLCVGKKTSSTFKLGKLQVSGQAATVFAPIMAVGLIIMFFVYWQNSKTREQVKPMIDLVMKAQLGD